MAREDPAVVPIPREAVPTVVAMLAAVFDDDPAMVHLFPDPARRPAALKRLLGVLLVLADKVGAAEMTTDGSAAALWRRPGRPALSAAEQVAQAVPFWLAIGPCLLRARALNAAVESHLPRIPFWYLQILGSAEPGRGEGRATALVARGLARAKADGVPCVLETTRPETLGFYRSLGFEVAAEWSVRNGPRFWTLQREP